MTRPLLPCCIAGLLLAASPVFAGETAARLTFSNDADERAPAQVVTFGQVFARDSIRPGAPLEVIVNGAAVPAQMNAKALYPDGSVRHGIFAVALPAMPAGAGWPASIAMGNGPSEAAHISGAIPHLDIQVSLPGANGKTREIDLDLDTIAHTPSSQRGAPWLSGSLLREVRYEGAVTPGLGVDFDVRTPAIGPASVDVIFHNDAVGTNPVTVLTYNVRILLDGKTVFSADSVKHYQYATWHRLVVAGGAPVPRVTADRDLLEQVGAVPRYADVEPDAKSVDEMVGEARKHAGQPLSTAGLTTYMPQTGGRPDLGPLPTWAVYYLLNPDARDYAMLIANADAAGSIPWHMRDPKTHGPLTNDAHPDVWLDERAHPSPNLLPKGFSMAGTGWTIDDAHQPSLTYLPYLLTGSRYYHDELEQQAAFDILWMNPEYRGAKGIVLGAQVRGFTWMMRTLANAAYILPSDEALQRYFQAGLEANLNDIIRKYVNGHEADWAGELKGFLSGAYNPDGAVAAWQDDYFTMVLGWIDAMGFPQARPILNWTTPFVAGLFTNGDRGYDPSYGTPYILFVYDENAKKPLGTWAKAFAASFDPVHKPVTSVEYPGWAGGYAALARGALGANFTVTRSPLTAEAYGFVLRQTGYMPHDYPKTPTFAIMPVMPDGSVLSLHDIHYADDSGGHLSASDHASILIGDANGDRLIGGAGSDLLYGVGGDNYLDGGLGDDYVFAGTGNDTLIVGPGADMLKAGKGADKFILKSPNADLPTILAFKPGKDRLIVSPALIEGGASALAQKISAATMSGGNLVITFGPKARVAFAGLGPKDVGALSAAISVAR